MLFTAGFAPDQSAAFSMIADGTEIRLPARNVNTRMGENAGYLDVSLDQSSVAAITGAREVRTWFSYGRALGGDFSAKLQLTDMDRKMLGAAFRLCP
jgi:hypothetical protein